MEYYSIAKHIVSGDHILSPTTEIFHSLKINGFAYQSCKKIK